MTTTDLNEWWYYIPDYHPTHIARAEAAYIARFGAFPGTPRQIPQKRGMILAYALPTPPLVAAAPAQLTLEV
jgi:hypothetical protein